MLRVIVGFPERGAAGVGATNGCDRGAFRCRPVGETDGVAQRGGVTMWKRNRFRWFWTEWTRLHPISFRMWKDRFTEEGYFDWPEAAFPEERRLCLSVELGLPARSLYEKTSPSGDGEAESHGGLFRIQRRRSCCR